VLRDRSLPPCTGPSRWPFPRRPGVFGSNVDNMLMVGPPGSGKSMLAARLPGILPPLGAREMLGIR